MRPAARPLHERRRSDRAEGDSPIASPQKTPRTRVRSSSGTVRWSSVITATSSTLFAAPMTASRTSAVAKYGPGAMQHDRQPPEDERDAEETASRSPRASSPRSRRSGRRRPWPRSGSRPRPRPPSSTRNDEDDDQDVQAAADEGLSGGEPDEQPGPRGARERAEARHDQPSRTPSPRRLTPTPALDPDSPSSAAPTRRTAAPARKTTLTLVSEASTPASERSDERPAPSTVEVAPFAAISSSGVSRERRQQRLQGRPHQGRRDAEAPRRTRSTSDSCLRRRAAADPARAAAPATSIASRKRSRLKRSPSDAANGATTAAGRRRTSPAMPTADAPPCS